MRFTRHVPPINTCDKLRAVSHFTGWSFNVTEVTLHLPRLCLVSERPPALGSSAPESSVYLNHVEVLLIAFGLRVCDVLDSEVSDRSDKRCFVLTEQRMLAGKHFSISLLLNKLTPV